MIFATTSRSSLAKINNTINRSIVNCPIVNNMKPIIPSRPLVAIDLGSHSVRAMAAKRIDGDVLRILGYEQSQKHPDYMERGVVVQSSNAGFMIGEVLRMLANRIGEKELPTAFVCTGGKSMQIHPVSARRDQCRPKEISPKLLEEMLEECRRKIEDGNPGVGVLGLVPSYFSLDGKEQDYVPTPDQRASVVVAHYMAFVSHKEVSSQLQKAFDQSGRVIESSFVRPEALLSVISTVDGNEALRRGCAVLDMGAQTSTLTIYKGGQYLQNKVVPQGSYHITRSIAQQGIASSMAEKLKCEYGYASPDEVEQNYRLRVPSTIPGERDLVVTSKELSELISLKLDEILAPIIKMVNEYANRIEILYLTGGGAMLNGVDHYLAERCPSLRVVYAAHNTLLTRDTDDEFCSPAYTSLVGTLLLAADYREEHPDVRVVQPPFMDRFKKKFEEKTLEIFSAQQ